MIIELSETDLLLDPRARGPWCKLPYPNHPSGCPNYGKRKTCPPFSKEINELIEPPYYLVIRSFDIEAQVKKMKDRHPEWSERQCRNLLYWQKGVVKKLKEEAKAFIESQDDDLLLVEIPEANGVNVFKTCENIRIILERNPRKIVIKIMLIGRRKKVGNTIDNG